jgi:hypothetical protein
MLERDGAEFQISVKAVVWAGTNRKLKARFFGQMEAEGAARAVRDERGGGVEGTG